MIWNPARRRYEENGHALTPAQVRQHVDEFIQSEQALVQQQADRLFARAITVAVFFAFMRQRITVWHGVAAQIAYGNQMNAERWRRVNDKIKSELNYLKDFEQQAVASFAVAEILASNAVKSIDVPPGLEPVVQSAVADALLQAAPSEAEAVARQAAEKALADSVDDPSAIAKGISFARVASAALLIGGTIQARGVMYADSIYSTYMNNVIARERDNGVTRGRRVDAGDQNTCDDCRAAATTEFIPLDEIVPIGHSQCLTRCRCDIELDLSGIESDLSNVEHFRLPQGAAPVFRPA